MNDGISGAHDSWTSHWQGVPEQAAQGKMCTACLRTMSRDLAALLSSMPTNASPLSIICSVRATWQVCSHSKYNSPYKLQATPYKQRRLVMLEPIPAFNAVLSTGVQPGNGSRRHPGARLVVKHTVVEVVAHVLGKHQCEHQEG